MLGVIAPLLILTHAHPTPNLLGLLPPGATDAREVLCRAVRISVAEGVPAGDLGVPVLVGEADREMEDTGEPGVVQCAEAVRCGFEDITQRTCAFSRLESLKVG